MPPAAGQTSRRVERNPQSPGDRPEASAHRRLFVLRGGEEPAPGRKEPADPEREADDVHRDREQSGRIHGHERVVARVRGASTIGRTSRPVPPAQPVASPPRAPPRPSLRLARALGSSRLGDAQLATVASVVLFVLGGRGRSLLTKLPPLQDLPNHLAAITVIQGPGALSGSGLQRLPQDEHRALRVALLRRQRDRPRARRPASSWRSSWRPERSSFRGSSWS